MSKRRVVVTGLGTINPLANNVQDSWEKLINGVSGIDYITSFDTEDLPVKFAGEVKDFDANEYMGKQHASCLLYTSPSPRDRTRSRMPSSA